MTKAPDVSDLAKAGTLPEDAAAGASPMPVSTLARDEAARLAKEQLENGIREMPAHLPSECELLSAILWSGTFVPGRLTVETVGDLIESPALFHLPAHRAIWDALLALAEAKTPATTVAVHAEMVHRRSERNGGGIAYLELLFRDAKPCSDVTARAYAQVIRDAWVRRLLIEAAKKIEADARNAKATIDEATGGATATLATVTATAVAANRQFVRLAKALADMSREMDMPAKPAVLTGFRDIDEATGGLTMQETSLLGARTSVGKTALACQWSENIARASGNTKAVFYISLEMRASLFAGRLAASRAGVPYRNIRRGTVTDDEKFMVRKAAFDLAKLHVYFVDNLVQTVESIHAGAKALRKKLAAEGVELALIVIDHVGLVKPSAATAKREKRDQVGETSRGLRYLATEHNCHVLGLSQIGRAAAQRTGEDAIPKLHEFKDSGGLEEDADNGFILHRARTKKGSFVPGAGADFIIAKARNDATAELRLDFDGTFIRFSNTSEEPDREDPRDFGAGDPFQ